MQLTTLRSIFEQAGPFATVYLEARSPGADAAGQMRLRWRALRERLESVGAAGGAIDVLAAELDRDVPGEEQADGRVLVAGAERVVLDAAWDAAIGAGDAAHWQELPDLGPYVREALRSVRALIVAADQHSARVRQEVVAEQHEPRTLDEQHVEGSAVEQVHKPRGQDLAHKRIQRRADEAAGQNARDIVERVRKIASEFRPHVLVLAGEVQARQALRTELPEELARVAVETDRGGGGDEASAMALADELLRIAGEYSEQAAEQRTERWQGALAHELAVQGAHEAAHAVEQGAVETLLLEPGADAKREAFLLKMCAKTGAEVDLVAEGTGLDDGVGAILRYQMTS